MAFEESAEFNLATLGATIDDLPFMAQSLVKLMKNDSRVDIKNHWKVRRNSCDLKFLESKAKFNN